MRISIQGQIYQVINFAHYFDNKNWHRNYPFSPDTSSGGIKAEKTPPSYESLTEPTLISPAW